MKKNTVQFIIPGPLMGYKQTTKKSIMHPKERAKSKAYGQWKEKVRMLAYKAGMTISGWADPDKPPRLSVQVFWNRSVVIDWKNVYGAIEDSLWHLPQGDKYVKPGKHSDVTWLAGVEQAIVTVEL
jgi:hypothetical protein